MSRERIALTIVLLLAVNACQAGGTNPASDRLHFKVIAGSVIVVPVLVNGRGPYDFVLDTGAESTLIDTDLAGELGVTPVDRMRLDSSNGSTVLARAFADKISVGAMRVLNSEVLIGSLDAVHTIDPHIRGMVGQSFLRHFDYILDNVHSTLELVIDPGQPTAIQGIRLGLRRTHALPIVTATLNDSLHAHLLLDSGASNLTLYRDAGKVVWRYSGTLSKAELRSSLRANQVAIGRIPYMEVAGYPFRNIEAALLNTNSNGEVDGMLPTNLFSKVYFNNSEAYIILAGER
jgi:predicted aspartyl protease